MAAGTIRTTVSTLLAMLYGAVPFTQQYAASVDELYPPFTIEVANGETDTSLLTAGGAGLTTIQHLTLVSTVAITVKLGAAGSNVAFALAANAPLMVPGTSLTAASVSNASGETALVTVLLGGT